MAIDRIQGSGAPRPAERGSGSPAAEPVRPAVDGDSLQLSPEALRVLMGHDWPGNVRELENALEYAVAVCSGQTILPEHLPDELTLRRRSGDGRPAGAAPPGQDAG